jgi:hypothetical protein
MSDAYREGCGRWEGTFTLLDRQDRTRSLRQKCTDALQVVIRRTARAAQECQGFPQGARRFRDGHQDGTKKSRNLLHPKPDRHFCDRRCESVFPEFGSLAGNHYEAH